MMDELPQSFDVVVVGTGVAESIVAAACSRVGKEVLHLDRNSYYGAAWSSFSWSGLQEWIIEASSELQPDRANDPGSGSETTLLVPKRPTFHHISQEWYISDDVDSEQGGDTAGSAGERPAEGHVAETGDVPEAARAEEQAPVAPQDDDAAGIQVWSKRRVEQQGRRFNVELAPKVIYSSGSLVGLLIQSNVSRYLEFKCITRILTKDGDEIVAVPCSRADVFASRGVSVVEKRMLMKLMGFVAESEKNPEILKEHEGEKFVDFLHTQSLTDKLVHFVVHSIAMVDADEATAFDGVRSMQRFLNSLGRFGNSPFLWPMFGSGEIPQAFCRLCAVFGGTYFLNRGVESVEIGPDEDCDGPRVKAVSSGGSRIECKQLVLDSTCIPQSLEPFAIKRSVSRAVLFTDRSIKASNNPEVTVFRIPKKADGGDTHPAVFMLELGPGASATPNGIFLVHLTCPMVKTPQEDFRPVIGEIFRFNGEVTDGSENEDSKPNILWCMYFAVDDYIVDEPTLATKGAGIHVLPGPADYVDFEHHVVKAKEVFSKMFPDEEFLPRAPDPDEIVIGGDDAPADPSPAEDMEENPETDGVAVFGEEGDGEVAE